MTTTRYDIVIVGGGHAGAQAAIALRQEKFAGTIAIVTAEPELPYERPPLSKDYLAGEKAFERILIRPEQFWADREITLLLGETVEAIDPEARSVRTASGRAIGYGDLIWAAGGAARRLACAGHHLAGIHAVRTRADVDRLVSELPAATNIVVVGGGYIGLEAAAALTRFGKSITLVESLDRVLARVAGEPLSRFYEAEHRAHGVRIMLGATVVCIEGKGGGGGKGDGDGNGKGQGEGKDEGERKGEGGGETAASGVRLADGEVLPADIVIVGIGIVPTIEPLALAGATVGNGVVIDAQCRTSIPHVYAIGDCAAHANRYAGFSNIRLESVQNANDQAIVAARTIVGRAAEYDAVPWFWSNQYDLKLQTVGLSIGYDRIVLRGEPDTRHFSVVYLRNGRLIALDAVNAVKDYVQARALIVEGARIAPEDLADATVQLKTLPRLAEPVS